MDHIQVAIDKILSKVDLDTAHSPCTTDKGSNMLAVTQAKCYINCACHRLSTSINTAWEAATEESDEFAVLDTNSNNLTCEVCEKAGGIQYNLPTTLKSGGKT